MNFPDVHPPRRATLKYTMLCKHVCLACVVAVVGGLVVVVVVNATRGDSVG